MSGTSRPRTALHAAMIAALLCAAPRRTHAQQAVAVVAPELRVDVIAARRTSVQGGVGVEIPAGYYARVGIVAAVGSRVDSAAVTGRVDVIARFLLDPFRQSRWGLSAGGGLTLRAEPGDRVRPALVAVVDLEGPRTTYRFSPAIQVGLGGGARVGVVLRWNGRTAR